MPHRGIAANQDELLEGRAGAALLQQPEQAFDRDIHYLVGTFLAGGAMHNVRHALHGRLHHRPIGDASPNYFQSLFGRQNAVVT